MIEVEMLRPTADQMLSGLTAGETLQKRLRFQAEAMDRLPEITGELLDGLHAGPTIRHRILVKAARSHSAHLSGARFSGGPAFRRAVPVVGMALALTVMIGLGANYASKYLAAGSVSPIATHGMNIHAAGQTADEAAPKYRSLFAGEGANPPLIGINGRYYRMLNSPAPVPASLKGEWYADTQVFTKEPSLEPMVGVISNIAPIGTPVFMVDGISKNTVCMAEVDGVMRLFQRVGYASVSTIGNELFVEDTLDIVGKVASLELSGVGVVNDEVIANDLIYMLSEFAVYHGSEIASGDQALTIYLQNGLSLQLLVQDDVLSGCGAWICPEFFEAFTSAVAAE